jgi:hypothetical protein
MNLLVSTAAAAERYLPHLAHHLQRSADADPQPQGLESGTVDYLCKGAGGRSLGSKIKTGSHGGGAPSQAYLMWTRTG